MNDIVWLSKKIKLSKLKDFHKNPRQISKSDFERLVQDIKQDGYHSRVKVDTNDVIIGGHQRKKALLQAGYKENDEVEVLYPNRPLTEEEFERLNIRDNLSFGEFDFDVLANEFDQEQLIEWGMPEEWFPEVTHVEGLTDEDDCPSLSEHVVTEPGDIWILGNHRLMCGDSASVDAVEKLMVGAKADMVFTDPPYNLAGESKNFASSSIRKCYKKLEESEWDKDFKVEPFLNTMLPYLNEGATVFVCTSGFLFGDIFAWMKECLGYAGYCVWCKPNPMPSLNKRRFTWATELICYGTKEGHIFNFPEEGHALSYLLQNSPSHTTEHPTEKPVIVPEHYILLTSKKGQLVLDLFGGSGTTLIVCEKNNRSCNMMELDPKYCDVIIKRWQDFTGKKAILESDGSTFDDLATKRKLS